MNDHAAASGPTAPVPKDPQPSVDRIDGLATRILSGDILLPKFQRSFVWDPPQIIALLDSVARGYPIGSVLLWQSRHELRSEAQIAGLDIELPRPDYPVNYLLDGQQRLSTICAAMYWNGSDPRSRWNLAYDLRKEAFLHLDALDEPPPHQIRLNKLPDPARYFGQIALLGGIDPDGDVLASNAQRLFNRFKDYKIATVTLGDMAIEDVAPIFERINSTGTALTIVDLMRAATWSPEFDLIDTIEELLDALADKEFSGIDKKVILRNISASAGGGFSTDSIDDLRTHSAESLKAAAEATKAAYLRTVDFLATEIRIPTAKVIPYSNQLTVLSEIFRRLPSPNAAQFAAIRTWFWRTALSGYFSGWNTGQMSADQTAAAAFADGETETVEVAAAEPRPDIWTTRQFRANNAHAKLLAIVLAHRGPTDLLTGQAVEVGRALSWDNQKEFHHFFPRDYLKNRGVSSQRINCLANIVMLTSGSNKRISNRAPSDYLAEVEQAAGADLDAWLNANLISQEAFAAAKADDFSEFLRLRSESLHQAILPLAGWEVSQIDEVASDEVLTSEEDLSDDSDFTFEPPKADAVGPE
ncbi:MAG: DUF262 domain-containing protein [Actinobacteria bacterium]|nr:DUF262 domain-containing protein [Actinomycetota bacterium]